jgi:oxygen-independent coproporphyrinogen-3 oxidase
LQEDRLLDLIMLQLRLSDGLDLQAVQQQYGAGVVTSLLPTVQQMMQRGLMQLAQGQDKPSAQLTSSGSSSPAAVGDVQEPGSGAALQQRLEAGLPCRVRLTDPAGFLLSNDVIAELFAALTELPSSETG